MKDLQIVECEGDDEPMLSENISLLDENDDLFDFSDNNDKSDLHEKLEFES